MNHHNLVIIRLFLICSEPFLRKNSNLLRALRRFQNVNKNRFEFFFQNFLFYLEGTINNDNLLYCTGKKENLLTANAPIPDGPQELISQVLAQSDHYNALLWRLDPYRVPIRTRHMRNCNQHPLHFHNSEKV